MRECVRSTAEMTRFYWFFFAIGALLIISISGESNIEKAAKEKCPENEICEPESGSGKVEVACKETDENGNCKDVACGEGRGLDPTTGECREVTECEDGPCEEKLQQMQESPRRLKKTRAKKGLHIALILKKKKHLMKPFMKPKPKPPPPHHGHHGHHHHHESEEEEEEEEAEPEPEDAPEGAPEIRLFNDEICVGGEGGTTGNCSNSTVAPETATARPRRPRQETPDPAEANVRKRVIRFLKVLRMRRRLNPFFGRIRKRNAPKVPPQEKMRK